ncbi:hypothetical protein ACHAWT_005902 [Skeletonema menzelii]|mmetsp:Transcript_19333/g.31730  ORF Transcript_19333/g.31730 Transcript_19333/m.31730 type:complete len:833 (+) Transcript_19333:250-2748(+)
MAATLNIDDVRCMVCQQSRCDIRIAPCGCLLHTTCIPMDILLSSQQKICPSCSSSIIKQIEVIPLPIAILEETSKLRAQDSEVLGNAEVISLAANASSHSTNVDPSGSDKKRSLSRTSACYRTGRWNAEESAYTNMLIKCFEMGILPLPHGMKMNDFLCNLLSCRTSRLTKKLKHAKLGSRTYRGGLNMDKNVSNMSNVIIHGGGIQRAQSLFLKTITPEWVRMELQFNISRMWRTHLANFCIQIGYLHLETKEWFSSLVEADYISTSSKDSSIEEKRKRMRLALCADANVAVSNIKYGNEDVVSTNAKVENGSQSEQDDNGVFVAGFPVKRLSEMNLKAMAEEKSADPQAANRQKERADSFFSFSSVQSKERQPSFSLEPFQDGDSTSMKHSSSFASIAELLEDSGNAEVNTAIDDAIDSLFEASKPEYKGKFLETISDFLTNTNAPFQHVDLWVPMDVGGSASVTATSSTKVNGVIYGGRQETTIRLSHAGFITPRSTKTPHTVAHRLNEFGLYSQNFSFSPGHGLPGRVYISCRPLWQSGLSSLGVEQFARVGGASIYGVNTALGLPIMTPVGTMVAIFYSTENFPRNAVWEQKCIEFCKTLQPEPRWKLVIDVGLKNNTTREAKKVQVDTANYAETESEKPRAVSVATSSPRDESAAYVSPKLSARDEASIVPASPIPAAKAAVKNNEPPYVWNEQSLALLLGKYMPLSSDSLSQSFSNTAIGNPNLASDLVTLRLLLLRHSSCRNSFEISLVNVIMKKYQTYIQAGHTEYEIMNLVMNDWKYLVAPNQIGNANMPSAEMNVNMNNSPSRGQSVPRVVSEVGPIKQEE